MNEIELKARVKDPSHVESMLNSFAEFKASVIREDLYFANDKINSRKIRIRKETSDSGTRWLLTYKKKENVTGQNGISTEVNNEMETTIEDPAVLEQYFLDSGFHVAVKKRKEVRDWAYENATIELCNVPPLGWFLEIEILSESDKPDVVAQAQDKLHEILMKSGLSDSDIENRYYSDLLKEAQKGSK